MKYVLEICANSISSAIAAQKGGANRIELCCNLNEGGTTPSYAQIKWCVANLAIETWPLIRPRGGDFLYSKAEFDCILEDIAMCKDLGCQGIVTGVLLSGGQIDLSRCEKIIKIAGDMPVAFHRAFDRCINPLAALDELINLSFVRVLTSGSATDAHLGIKKIKQLVDQAATRIEIMPGAGINPTNLAEIVKTTGANCFHTTAKNTINSTMNTNFLKENLFQLDDNQWMETDEEIVSQLVSILSKI